MVFIFILFQKTVLYMAVENELIDFVKLLLTNPTIQVNIKYILKFNYLNA